MKGIVFGRLYTELITHPVVFTGKVQGRIRVASDDRCTVGVHSDAD